MTQHNEPAFPRPLSKLTNEEISGEQTGMTLCDYFAAAALTGLLTTTLEDGGEIAQLAYQYANAMLAERQKATTP